MPSGVFFGMPMNMRSPRTSLDGCESRRKRRRKMNRLLLTILLVLALAFSLAKFVHAQSTTPKVDTKKGQSTLAQTADPKDVDDSQDSGDAQAAAPTSSNKTRHISHKPSKKAAASTTTTAKTDDSTNTDGTKKVAKSEKNLDGSVDLKADGDTTTYDWSVNQKSFDDGTLKTTVDVPDPNCANPDKKCPMALDSSDINRISNIMKAKNDADAITRISKVIKDAMEKQTKLAEKQKKYDEQLQKAQEAFDKNPGLECLYEIKTDEKKLSVSIVHKKFGDSESSADVPGLSAILGTSYLGSSFGVANLSAQAASKDITESPNDGDQCLASAIKQLDPRDSADQVKIAKLYQLEGQEFTNLLNKRRDGTLTAGENARLVGLQAFFDNTDADYKQFASDAYNNVMAGQAALIASAAADPMAALNARKNGNGVLTNANIINFTNELSSAAKISAGANNSQGTAFINGLQKKFETRGGGLAELAKVLDSKDPQGKQAAAPSGSILADYQTAASIQTTGTAASDSQSIIDKSKRQAMDSLNIRSNGYKNYLDMNQALDEAEAAQIWNPQNLQPYSTRVPKFGNFAGVSSLQNGCGTTTISTNGLCNANLVNPNSQAAAMARSNNVNSSLYQSPFNNTSQSATNYQPAQMNAAGSGFRAGRGS
jgi:hypothetical protein